MLPNRPVNHTGVRLGSFELYIKQEAVFTVYYRLNVDLCNFNSVFFFICRNGLRGGASCIRSL